MKSMQQTQAEMLAQCHKRTSLARQRAQARYAKVVKKEKWAMAGAVGIAACLALAGWWMWVCVTAEKGA